MLLFDVLAVRAGHLLFDFRNVGLLEHDKHGRMPYGYPME